jgi:predicted Zn-dependent protease
MEDVVSMLCWGGFSARALATRQSSLSRMRDDSGEAMRLDPRITMTEAIGDGVAAAFQGEGFLRPASVPLIAQGRLVGSLVSPRTAREFSLEANGASGHESPVALAMAGGALASADALAALGTACTSATSTTSTIRPPGVPDDRHDALRDVLGEDGKIVAPIDVLRFYDTIYRMLGANLEALTAETELLLASDSYRERSLASMRLPGALLSELTFTL